MTKSQSRFAHVGPQMASGRVLTSLPLFALGLALPLVGCSGDSAGPVAPASFAVSSTSLTVSGADAAQWQLNREILIHFTQSVDFSSVSLASIRIVDTEGVPAVGTLSQAGPRAVRFQPQCPTGAGGLSAGLQAGRTYRLSIASKVDDAAAPALLSTAGESLAAGVDITFQTPASTDEGVLFHDAIDGGPGVRILSPDEATPDGGGYSYVELGGDPDDVEYFRFDPADQRGEVAGELPLNLYSDPTQQVAIVLAFDQPILDTPANVSDGMILLEYHREPSGEWRRMPATVTLESNCSNQGATVRVSPLGILPQGSAMRVAVLAGFQDLSGQPTTAAQTSFAVFQTTALPPNSSFGQRSVGSDEILEHFTVGGDAAGSMEDTSFPSSLPRADWGGGTATAAFDFPGTGGTGGDFDLVVRSGETIFINTASDVVVGGPGGAPTTTQPVINGVLDVNDLTVEVDARLVFIGPNTASILASGEVKIAGLVSVNGGDNFGVGSLNTTNLPEFGAPGQAGGGRGGTASSMTSQSTPQGSPGTGAFGGPGLGGGGGETSFAPNGCVDDRRGAGGGGGAFGRSVRYYVDEDFSKPLAICQTFVGLDGEPGFTGSPDGTGAISQSAPAVGGDLGPGPFTDPSPNNDFFGTMLTADGAQIRGELPSVWAGAGGGGGGDAVASDTFPLTPFVATGDEKGAGGGGGAGGLAIFAVGDIVVEPGGELTANGGSGGGGENTSFFDRIGGGSGGGSGGHIVLSSARSIVIESEAVDPTVGPFYRDSFLAITHVQRPVSALGGQGGAGRRDRCGAGANGVTSWRADGIPFEAFEGREDIPPFIPGQLPNTFDWCNEMSFCAVGAVPEGTIVGGGGDGSPGLIQLHVTDPDTQLVFGSTGETGYLTAGIDVTRSMAPPPVGWRTPTDRPDTLVPFFGASSESYSRWIPLGFARLNPDGSSNPLEFVFEGTSPEGAVLRDGEMAQELAPIVPFERLSVGGAAPSINTLTATLLIKGAALADPRGLYSQNPALLREFAVRFRDSGTPADAREFSVVAATYDEVAGEFALDLDAMGFKLTDDIAELSARPGELEAEVVPFFFRLETSGVSDAFPIGSDVRILFDATIADPVTGAPSSAPEAAFSARVDINGQGLDDKNGFTGDIDELNGLVAAPGQTNPMDLTLEMVNWDFVRFNVAFDLATGGASPAVDAPRPGLDFLRLPFRF